MVARLNRPAAAAGAAMAAVAVMLGAFGAHALKAVLGPEALGWWQTGVQYQMWHALALLALGVGGLDRTTVPAALLGGGALIFSSTLYAMALGAPRWLGAVTPMGGAMMIAGWLWLALEWPATRGGRKNNGRYFASYANSYENVAVSTPNMGVAT